MPHVAMVAMSGFRVREREMFALGMSLPGLASRAGAVAALPALGLLTLAGMTPAEWSVSYHEAPGTINALLHEVMLTRPRLVAISALTASIQEAYALGDRLREEGALVVIGGLHVTTMAEEAAAHVDAVVIGDGEPVWHQVLADAAAGRIRRVYQASAPFDLARAPVPRFELLMTKDRPRFTLQTSRGCPLACDFCGASRLLGPFREKPTARIAEELESLRALSRRPLIELADDNTFAGRRDPRELLEVLGRAGARWFTECDWRIGERPAVLETLAASGCVQVLMGMESMVHRHEGMGAKGAAFDRMVRAAERVQEHGVAVIACFVVGSDGEDMESMQALGEFLATAPFADVQLTLVTPFPGTALRARLAREGRLVADRGWESCTLFDVAFVPDRLSVGELESGFRSLVKYVFSAELSARRSVIRQHIWTCRGEKVS